MKPETPNLKPTLASITTADGSKSLHNAALDETYHSRHGALQESEYVFIDQGLKARVNLPITSRQTVHGPGTSFARRNPVKAGYPIPNLLHLLEIGFGTGLNALLTLREKRSHSQSIHYTTLETFPLEAALVDDLGYHESIENVDRSDVRSLHEAAWDTAVELESGFVLEKRNTRLQDFDPIHRYDLIYYDAFGPRAQPEMWEKPLFEKLYDLASPNAILVTYCAKGQVRRDLISSGWEVERLAGPPGKRHMLRARK